MTHEKWVKQVEDIVERLLALRITGGNTDKLQSELRKLLEERKPEPK